MRTGLSAKIEIKQLQRLQLNPQLLQSIAVLCMNNTELAGYIDKLYQENPCIEKSEPEIPEEMLQVISRYRSSDYSAASGQGPGRSHSIRPDQGEKREAAELSSRYVDDYIESLNYNLKSQLEKLPLDRTLFAVCVYLVDMLEDNGRLTRESLDAVQKLGVPAELTEKAAAVIKSLEPAGVGAEDVNEFIRLQLERYYPGEELAIRLTSEEYLGAVARQHFQVLADELDVDIREVVAAAELIRSLNTEIHSGYAKPEETVYVRPDVYVYVDREGKLVTAANGYDVPRVSVSERYLELYRETEDAELKKYLREKISETYRLISSIGRRESTLQKCFNYIVSEQSEFFRGTRDTLKPMTMSDAAAALDVNVSTISRCVMNKYVQCSAGLFPAKYFFPRALGKKDGAAPSQLQSAQGAKNALLKLIGSEDHLHPYSDAALCELLNEKGFALKRRTVAKYRDELQVPDYRLRKTRYLRG